MLEVFTGLGFIFAIWVLGRSAVSICSAIDSDWLAMPIGLCLIGLTANLLYFGIGLTIPWIQRLLLFALLLCLYWNIRQGIGRQAWKTLLAVCGIFMLLAFPAWIGGEQYYVFRGNHWDHFNYINQALALLNNPYSVYHHALAGNFLDNDIFAHALLFIGKRPAVGLVFALLLPGGVGDIHLLAFLYVTVLWSLVFPAMYYAWKRILAAYEFKTNGIWFSICPPLAYVVGRSRMRGRKNNKKNR